MRFLYNFLFYLSMPVILLRLLWRSRLAPSYRSRWRERFALFSESLPKQGIWLHAVSVGEVIAAVPLVKALKKNYPSLPIIMTTMTPTGSEQVNQLVGEWVYHVYAPYDLPGSVKRFLRRTRPKIAIIMETELWPNLLHYSHKKNIPIMIANGRLSARSQKGYLRFKKITHWMLQHVDSLLAQSEADGERYETLGLDKAKIKITGSIKFDLQLPASLLEQGELLRQQWGATRSIFIAASTHDGEDEKILSAYKIIKNKIPDALLVLVPRHPERFTKVFNLCKKMGFETGLRSQKNIISPNMAVLVGDTMGELKLLFSASDVAFIGGSLVQTGGHNMLEPAALGLPVLTGPHVFNFTEITHLLKSAGGLIMVDNSDELAHQVIKLLGDSELRELIGNNAKGVVEKNKGSIQRHLDEVERLLNS